MFGSRTAFSEKVRRIRRMSVTRDLCALIWLNKIKFTVFVFCEKEEIGLSFHIESERRSSLEFFQEAKNIYVIY